MLTTVRIPFMSRALRQLILSLCCVLGGAGVWAADAPRNLRFDIPAQPLESALLSFSEQAGVQLVVANDTIKGLQSDGVQGEYSTNEALALLLQGSGLSYRVTDERTIAIGGAGNAQKGKKVSEAADVLRLAHAGGAEGGQAVAEERPGAAAGGDEKIQEVIVTATKRSESVQDIPMSIAVISTQDIERRGLIGMQDYLRSIPGVNQIDRGGDNAIVIRGISTSPQSENFSSGTTVATYFDETPITGAAGLGTGGIDVRPVDLERIEVLRGPQGTTFGNSSLGGAVRLIPAKPKLDRFDGNVAASYSDTSGFGSESSMIQGMINIPLVTDKFALRAVGYRYDESGYYRNIAATDPVTLAWAQTYGLASYVGGSPENDIGRMRSTGGRIAALWKPTEKLDLSMNYLSQKIEQDGRPEASVGTFEQAREPVAPQARVRGQSGEVNDANMDLLNLVLNYDLGWATLTSAASWVDGGSVYAYAQGTARFSAFYGPASSTGPSHFKSFTEETRLASKFDGPFQFLGGVFYEDVDDKLFQTIDWPGTPATNPYVSSPMFLYDARRQLDHRAVFGEVSYDLTEKLTATVGGRYFKYDKDQSVLQEGGVFGLVNGVPRTPIGAGVTQFLSSSEDGSTFKANLSYKPTKDALLYAGWSEGFRLGRPDAGLPAAICDTDNNGIVDGGNLSIESTRTVNPDYLENYEIGGKLALFDRRMVVDTAVYHIKWDGLPIRAIAACGLAYVANVGAATSDGVELQASFAVTEGLRVDFGGGYTKAELSEDAPGLGAREGARLPGSPKVSANLAAQYDFDVAGYKAFVRADSFYTGKFYGDLLQTPAVAAGDYIKVDARAGVAIKNLRLELFVRNLTNEDAYTWRGLSVREPLYGFRMRPRTIGIQVGYDFE